MGSGVRACLSQTGLILPCLAPPSSSLPSLDVLVSRAKPERERETIIQPQHLHPLPDNCTGLRVESTLIPATTLLSAEKASPCIHKCTSIKHPRASHSYIISSLTWIINPVTPRWPHSPFPAFVCVIFFSSWLTGEKETHVITKTQTYNHKQSQWCVIKAEEIIYYWWVMWSPSGKPWSASISFIPAFS